MARIATHPRGGSALRRLRFAALAALAASALAVPAAPAEARKAKPRVVKNTAATAVVPSCADLTWKRCDRKLRGLGFTSFDRAIDPYNNCPTCSASEVFGIIDDFGVRIEGWTIPTGAHFIVLTNPDRAR